MAKPDAEFFRGLIDGRGQLTRRVEERRTHDGRARTLLAAVVRVDLERLAWAQSDAEIERVALACDLRGQQACIERGHLRRDRRADPSRRQHQAPVRGFPKDRRRGVEQIVRQAAIVEAIFDHAGSVAGERDPARVEPEVFDGPHEALPIVRMTTGPVGQQIAAFLVVAVGVAEARGVFARVARAGRVFRRCSMLEGAQCTTPLRRIGRRLRKGHAAIERRSRQQPEKNTTGEQRARITEASGRSRRRCAASARKRPHHRMSLAPEG